MIKSQTLTQSGKSEGAKHFKIGDIVEGIVVGKGRSAMYIDIGPQATGIIQGREFAEEKATLKHLNPGDAIAAKIVDLENGDGYVELSTREAGRQLTWERLKEMKAKEEVFPVRITSVNKGGLMTELLSVPAFLPVSQLSQEHYPKVEGGDAAKILKALQKFVDTELEVQVFDIDPKEQKIILSERSKERNKAREILSQYKVGDVVNGEITGVVDFGAFIKFPAEADPAVQIEGLIHISEIDWQIIDDPSQFIKAGDRVQAKIIDIANQRASLSLKALKEDPWQGIETRYKKLDTVQGKVTKLNPFGAFVEIEPRIQGLCHISEFGTKKKMDEILVAGEIYAFQILELNPLEHRMSLRVALKEAE
ncbi:MAG: S1 RNA-binding domain-containing protein [Candidatus Wildermuthbacteria bacterium]|nr:S1 RNA-binding domain-containing protein [Candidatus Wildermuthbacteria bacterium]